MTEIYGKLPNMSSPRALVDVGAGEDEALALELNRRAGTSIIYSSMRRDATLGGRLSPWRVAPRPFPLTPALADRMAALGPVFQEFLHACNSLYRASVAGAGAPAWVARVLDHGKPQALVDYQRSPRHGQRVVGCGGGAPALAHPRHPLKCGGLGIGHTGDPPHAQTWLLEWND